MVGVKDFISLDGSEVMGVKWSELSPKDEMQYELETL